MATHLPRLSDLEWALVYEAVKHFEERTPYGPEKKRAKGVLKELMHCKKED